MSYLTKLNIYRFLFKKQKYDFASTIPLYYLFLFEFLIDKRYYKDCLNSRKTIDNKESANIRSKDGLKNW